MTTLALDWLKWKEDSRHNQAMERETNRANVAKEKLGISNLEEMVRSNKARETETNRANLRNEEIREHDIAVRNFDNEMDRRNDLLITNRKIIGSTAVGKGKFVQDYIVQHGGSGFSGWAGRISATLEELLPNF